MKDLINFIKKTWWLFLLLFVAPILVLCTFAVLEYIFHMINMSAGEWAGLLSAAFGYWGSVLLGTLAFWQNERVTTINKRLLAIEEIEREQDNKPKIVIKGIELFTKKTYIGTLEEYNYFRGDYNYKAIFTGIDDDYKDFLELYILMKNDSMAEIYDLIYTGCGFVLTKDELDYTQKEIIIEKIKTNEEFYLFFKPDIKDNKFFYEISINYKNLYGHEYYQRVEVASEIDKKSKDNTFNVSIRQYIMKDATRKR